MDYVIDVNPMKLFEKMRKQRIPFHFWYPWVEKEIIDIAKTQKPDLYKNGPPSKKPTFMQRIKGMFKKDNSDAATTSNT